MTVWGEKKQHLTFNKLEFHRNKEQVLESKAATQAILILSCVSLVPYCTVLIFFLNPFCSKVPVYNTEN